MKCPYCLTAINYETNSASFYSDFDDDQDNGYELIYGFCPECHKLIVTLLEGTINYSDGEEYIDGVEALIYPKYYSNTQLSVYIPQKYADVFKEAEQVNNISPRASATLSRYLLQMVLHEELNIKERNLEEEIRTLESKRDIPSQLITLLQVLRRVANFGAHPKKSTHSAEILEVEEGESAVMLEVIKELFDFLFVKPAQQKEFLEEIEKKYGIKSGVEHY